MGRLMGLDYGDSRIGVAMSDPMHITASGKCVVDGTKGIKHVISEIGALVAQNDVEKIIIGYPLNMNGTQGIRVERTEKFISRFQEEYPDVEIIRLDERRTTVAADRAMREMGVSQRKKGVSDMLAAAFILQGYIESVY
jgi:putative Holliday junction resolvase